MTSLFQTLFQNGKRHPTLLHWFSSGVPEDADLPADRSLAERKQALDAFKADSKAFKAIRAAWHWRSADRRARALLAEASPVPQYTRQQLAADGMLKHWLLDGNHTPEQRHALAFYTELMIRNRSPQAQILLPALEYLEGHWPDARIAESARVAADAARNLLQKRGVALDEAVSRSMAKNMNPDAAGSFAHSSSHLNDRLISAIAQLDALAERMGR